MGESNGRLALISVFVVLAAMLAIAFNAIGSRSGCDTEIPSEINFGLVKPSVLRKEVVAVCRDKTGTTLIDFKASCGCTAIGDVLPMHLALNESAAINLTFDCQDYVGSVRKTVVIGEIRRGVKHSHRISVVATVDGGLKATISPNSVNFGDLGTWEVKEQGFTIRRSGAPIRNVVFPEGTPRWIVHNGTSTSDNERIFNIGLRNPPEGPLRQTVDVKVDDEILPIVLKGTVHASPFSATDIVAATRSGAGWAFSFNIHGRQSPALEIADVTLNGSDSVRYRARIVSAGTTSLHCSVANSDLRRTEQNDLQVEVIQGPHKSTVKTAVIVQSAGP